MILERIAIHMLLAILDVETLQLGAGPIARENRLDTALGEAAAQFNRLQRRSGVASEQHPLGMKIVDRAAQRCVPT